MKRFHQILDTSIVSNLEDYTKMAECLENLIDKVPKEEILQHLKTHREKLKSTLLSSLGSESTKDLELIDKSFKKIEKGDFSLHSGLISRKNDLQDFYMDPEERDRQADRGFIKEQIENRHKVMKKDKKNFI